MEGAVAGFCSRRLESLFDESNEVTGVVAGAVLEHEPGTARRGIARGELRVARSPRQGRRRGPPFPPERLREVLVERDDAPERDLLEERLFGAFDRPVERLDERVAPPERERVDERAEVLDPLDRDFVFDLLALRFGRGALRTGPMNRAGSRS